MGDRGTHGLLTRCYSMRDRTAEDRTGRAIQGLDSVLGLVRRTQDMLPLPSTRSMVSGVRKTMELLEATLLVQEGSRTLRAMGCKAATNSRWATVRLRRGMEEGWPATTEKGPLLYEPPLLARGSVRRIILSLSSMLRHIIIRPFPLHKVNPHSLRNRLGRKRCPIIGRSESVHMASREA